MSTAGERSPPLAPSDRARRAARTPNRRESGAGGPRPASPRITPPPPSPSTSGRPRATPLHLLRDRETRGTRGRCGVAATPGARPPSAPPLAAWAEAASLPRLAPAVPYMSPPPRSTIAAAFSPDGEMLASTQ